MTLGEKIKQLRETLGLTQRAVGAPLELDSTFMSKVERNEKRLNRKHLPELSKLLKVDVQELETLWLADQVYKVIENEALGDKALRVAEEEFNYRKNKGHGKNK